MLIRRLRIASLALLLTATGACDTGPRDGAPGTAGADSLSSQRIHARELIFVGQRAGEPLVASIAFRTADGQRTRAREIRGWLARGGRWETFLDERWSAVLAGSPWTIVPHGNLDLAAGGPGEVEAIWFERSGRSLRLEIDQALAQWNRGASARVRLFSGTARVGGELTRGTVLELLQLKRPGQDAPGLTTHLLVTSGDTLTLLVVTGAERGGEEAQGIAWMRNGDGVREWTEVATRSVGGKPLQDARREIPRAWSFAVPEAEMRGQLFGRGFAAETGAERAGRRGVEARYTVTGWVELGGTRTRVVGTVRYSVD